MTAEEAKRSSFGRNSLGRKLRGMKRIMGKKSTPPASPAGSTGTAASGGVRSPVGLPRVGGVGPYSVSLGGPSGEGAASQAAKGKAFLDEMDGGGGGGDGSGGSGGSGTDDISPDGTTASLSTGTGGGDVSTSGDASPSTY